MTPSVTCYSQPDKAKSRRVLEAFAAGCGGRMASTDADRLEPGDVAFYGVGPVWAHLWRQAQIEGRNVYYLDNSFWDDTREIKFRVGRNVVQMHEFPRGQYPAFRRPIQPWRAGGEHIVVCPQSDAFMRTVEKFAEDWVEWVSRRLRMHTTRPLVIRWKRRWHPGPKARIDWRPLSDDLRGAWAVVAHTSAAANEALIAGIPAFTTGLCAATAMSNHDLSSIERPKMPDGREQWAAAVAAHEWTLTEIANGDAWRSLHA